MYVTLVILTVNELVCKHGAPTREYPSARTGKEAVDRVVFLIFVGIDEK